MLRRLHRIVDVDHAAAPVLTLVFLGGMIACALHLPKIRRIRPCQKKQGRPAQYNAKRPCHSRILKLARAIR
jgi:hypothetical protein